jgi:hypothetical protein
VPDKDLTGLLLSLLDRDCERGLLAEIDADMLSD